MEYGQFVARLAAEGFAQVLTVVQEANGSLPFHTHPFEAKALIIEGEIRIQAEGDERLYGVGQIFHLAANLPHSESYGPQGVRYVVGRK